MNPIRNWGTFHTRLNASNDATFKGIDVKSRSASIGLTHSDYKL